MILSLILLSKSSVNVHVSHPSYSIIEMTSDLYKSIFVWMEILLLFHIVFNLTNADVAVAILIFISDSLLPSLVKVTHKYLNLSTVSSIFHPRLFLLVVPLDLFHSPLSLLWAHFHSICC